MRKQRTCILTGACLVLVVTAAALFLQPQEPRYQGRTLSQWLHQLPAKYADRPPPVSPEGKAAIRHMGTNAVATALDWISYEPSAPRQWLAPLVARVGESHRPRVLSQGYRHAIDAETVFDILGPDAKAAIPELCRLAATAQGEARVGRCVRALEAIGPEALPAFLALMENPRVKDRAYVVEQLLGFETNALPAIPALVKHLDDPDQKVANTAALVLPDLSPTNPILVKLFTARLQSTNPWSRWAATFALQRLGVAARPAIPALRQALNDPDANVREQAGYALSELEPELGTNASEKSLEPPSSGTSP